MAHSESISDRNKINIIGKLSEYAGFYGMTGGQYVDMESESKRVGKDILE